MAYEKFIDKKFSPETLAVIAQARALTEDFQRRGYVLTLRQLYYQFVSKGLLANKLENYKRLGRIVDEGRQAGELDWATIEDRLRNVEKPNVWTSPESIIAAVAQQYAEDPWRGQKYRPEIWIEKDALVGVIEGICTEFSVPYLACRGYLSQSEAYSAGKRFAAYRKQGFVPLVLHLGDHDPSGVNMTDDNEARLRLFSRGLVEVRRLALNMDQVTQYDPPPNPSKDTDSRHDGYKRMMIDEHGYTDPDDDEDADPIPSWELDALDPDVINQMIRDELEAIIDQEAWDEAKQKEADNKEGLEAASSNWSGVRRYLKYRDEGVTDDDVDPTVEDRLVELEESRE